MGDDEQQAMHADQLALQERLAEIVINAYMMTAMTYEDLKLLVSQLGLQMADVENASLTLREEDSIFATSTRAPVDFSEGNF